MFWILHDLLQTVQDIQYNFTFLSFLLILGPIKSRLMKRHVISYVFYMYIFSTMPAALADEMYLSLITILKMYDQTFIALVPLIDIQIRAVCNYFVVITDETGFMS